jgi:hypothetical protein
MELAGAWNSGLKAIQRQNYNKFKALNWPYL